MPARDYETSPVSDELGLVDIIKGLASDIQGVRDGTVSIQDAHARAALAKQLFNGCRIYLQAVKTIESSALNVSPALPTPKDTE